MGFLLARREIYRDIYVCKVGRRLHAVNLQSLKLVRLFTPSSPFLTMDYKLWPGRHCSSPRRSRFTAIVVFYTLVKNHQVYFVFEVFLLCGNYCGLIGVSKKPLRVLRFRRRLERFLLDLEGFR